MKSQPQTPILSRRGSRYAKIQLMTKVRLLKCVLLGEDTIKKISEKLNIKYSTAKTLVKQFKDQHLKINLDDYQDESSQSSKNHDQKRRCEYQDIRTSQEQFALNEEDTAKSNALQGARVDVVLDARSYISLPPKIQIISKTLNLQQ